MHEQRNNNYWYQPTNVAAAKQQADLDLKQVKQKYSNEKKKKEMVNFEHEIAIAWSHKKFRLKIIAIKFLTFYQPFFLSQNKSNHLLLSQRQVCTRPINLEKYGQNVPKNLFEFVFEFRVVDTSVIRNRDQMESSFS